jgi:uncharacterized protein (DUF362 family)
MNTLNRRDFFKKGLFAGAGIALIPSMVKGINASETELINISSVTGNDPFMNTITAIEHLGGIQKFVPRGSKVGLLINAPDWWNNPGSHTNTAVVLAVLKLLNDANAKEISYLINPSKEFYKRSELSSKYQSIIDSVKQCSYEYKQVDIPKAVILKKANVIKELFEVDVLINIPVNKHHSGVEYTGCLKNMMGACNRDTNKTFHTDGEGAGDDIEHLAQCIADVNLLRKPDLCITDATEVLKTNGPAGPGMIIKPHKVFVGTNPVEMDAYGCTLLDNRPQDIRTNILANKLGLGSYDLEKLIIKQYTA